MHNKICCKEKKDFLINKLFLPRNNYLWHKVTNNPEFL